MRSLVLLLSGALLSAVVVGSMVFWEAHRSRQQEAENQDRIERHLEDERLRQEAFERSQRARREMEAEFRARGLPPPRDELGDFPTRPAPLFEWRDRQRRAA